jgi:hypothetical protein
MKTEHSAQLSHRSFSYLLAYCHHCFSLQFRISY